MYLERRIANLIGLELTKRMDQLVAKLAAVELRSSNTEKRVDLLEDKPGVRQNDETQPQWRSLPVHVTSEDLGDQFLMSTHFVDREKAFSGIDATESNRKRGGLTQLQTLLAEDEVKQASAVQATTSQPRSVFRGLADAERNGCCSPDLLDGKDVGSVMCADASHGLVSQKSVISRPRVYPIARFGYEESAKVLPLSSRSWPAMDDSSEGGCFSV